MMSPLEQFRLQLILEFEEYRQEMEKNKILPEQIPQALDGTVLLSEVSTTSTTVQ